MISRIIHLNWLDEAPSAKALAAVEYWQQNGEGREVVLHGDSTPLRKSWRENYLAYARNHQNKSDWMRWSSMLDVGGWYFDVDIRPVPGASLDAVEAGMAPGTCLLVPMIAGMRPLEANIICCPFGWQGAETVNTYMLEKHDRQPAYVHYTLGMANRLYHAHHDWFTIGSANTLRNDWRNADRQSQRPVISTKATLCDTCTDRLPDCWKAINYGCIHSEAYERREKLRRGDKCPRVSNKSIVPQR